VRTIKNWNELVESRTKWVSQGIEEFSGGGSGVGGVAHNDELPCKRVIGRPRVLATLGWASERWKGGKSLERGGKEGGK